MEVTGHRTLLDPRPAIVVGLLGGIGSGKSEVAKLFADAGAAVLSGDTVGHQALVEPELKERIVQRFGSNILDEKGRIERRRLGGIVFADPQARRDLEAIVHPWIKARLKEQVETLRQEGRVRLIVLDAAVMLEAKWDSLCDALIYVDAPRPLRLQRVAQTRGWTEEEVEARECAQLPLTAKARIAHYTVSNSGTRDDLRSQVDALLNQWGIRSAPRRDPGT